MHAENYIRTHNLPFKDAIISMRDPKSQVCTWDEDGASITIYEGLVFTTPFCHGKISTTHGSGSYVPS